MCSKLMEGPVSGEGMAGCQEGDRHVGTDLQRRSRTCEHSSLLPPSPTKLPDVDTKFCFPQGQNPSLVGFFSWWPEFSECLLNEGVTEHINTKTEKLLV